MTDHHHEMTPAELRKFAFITSALFGLLFGLFIPWKFELSWPLWPWIIGAVLVPWGVVAPASLIHVYKPWMKFAEALGFVNTRIILFLLFYVIFLPIGLFMRIFGHDAMRRKPDPQSVSYRINCETQSRDHMETPY